MFLGGKFMSVSSPKQSPRLRSKESPGTIARHSGDCLAAGTRAAVGRFKGVQSQAERIGIQSSKESKGASGARTTEQYVITN